MKALAVALLLFLNRNRAMIRFPSIALSIFLSAVCASGATFTVINSADSGVGSLRQAITDANAAGGGTVAFNIPSPPRTITLSSSLPLAGPAVVIDGTTQPGYAGNPLIEISGANIPLPFSASNPCVRTSGTLRGLAVNRCYVDVEGIGAPVVAANWIGLNLSGGFATPNIHGIHLTPGSSGAVIGGSSFTDANIISATNDGIFSDSASNVTISHNRIGASPSGTVYVGGSLRHRPLERVDGRVTD